MKCNGFDYLIQKPLDFIVNEIYYVDFDIPYPSFDECNIEKVFMTITHCISMSAILMFIGILIYHKIRYKTYKFDKWVNKSIFTLFDDYYMSKFINNSVSDFSILQTEVIKSPEQVLCVKKRTNSKLSDWVHRKNVYIFDCEQYCCLCCCDFWVVSLYNPILNKLKLKYREMKRFFYGNIKIMAFYSVSYGFMLFKPIEYILSLFLANPCIIPTDGYNNYILLIFVFFDLVLSFWYTFNIYFLMAFITLRREIQRIDPRDKLARAYVLRFTLLKGLIFGFFIFILKILLIWNSGRYFYEISKSSPLAVYTIGRQLIFLSLMAKSVLFCKNMAIKNDDDILKEESKIFKMQNYFYKRNIRSIGVIAVIEQLKLNNRDHNEYNEEKLNKEIEDVYSDKIKELETIFQINDAQHFKNILIKTRNTSKYTKGTAFFILLDCFLVTSANVMILASFSLDKNDEICLYETVIDVLMLIVSVMEHFIIPYFIFKAVRTKNFFGKEEIN